VAWNMSESRRFVLLLRRAPAADRAILLITFVLTVFADLVVAVNVGVILAVLQFLRRMAETTETQPVAARALGAELRSFGLTALPPSVMVYEIAGPMFFGAVENFRRALLEMRPGPETLIIRLDRVPFMDITGIQTLEEVTAKLRKRGVLVLLCEANARVHAKLQMAGVGNVAPVEAGADVARAPADGIYCDSLRDALIRAGALSERIVETH